MKNLMNFKLNNELLDSLRQEYQLLDEYKDIDNDINSELLMNAESASLIGDYKKSLAFSAIRTAMKPNKSTLEFLSSETKACPFGFFVNEDQNNENDDISSEFHDEENQRKWNKFLYSKISISETDKNFNEKYFNLWNQLPSYFEHDSKLSSLVINGIPHKYRSELWPRISGSTLMKLQTNKRSYQFETRKSMIDNFYKQELIQKTATTVFKNHSCYFIPTSIGFKPLIRVVSAFLLDHKYIEDPTCIIVIAGYLLLIVSEENTYWMLNNIYDFLLPNSYFSQGLKGIRVDLKVLRQLLASYSPKVDETLRLHNLDISKGIATCFMSLYASHVPCEMLMRIWDIFFYEGSLFLFKMAINLLNCIEEQLRMTSPTNIASLIYNSLRNIPDHQIFISKAWNNYSGLTDEILEVYRKKHSSVIEFTEHLIKPTSTNSLNLSQMTTTNFWNQLFKFSVKDLLYFLFLTSKTTGLEILSSTAYLCAGKPSTYDSCSIKSKNIIRSELLLNFRDSIQKIVYHFKMNKAHTCENLLNNINPIMKRCVAIEDFQSNVVDDLNFKCGQIIELLTLSNKHCFLGEFDGKRGWFPSKCVRLLDEKFKKYEICGDDALNERIGSLVKDDFLGYFLKILKCGSRNFYFLPQEHQHPWYTFKEMVNNFTSHKIYLSESFALEEDVNILSAIEKLNKIMLNVETKAFDWQLDSKLCLIICYGLNEQILHEWIEILCTNHLLIEKRYLENAFLRSPVWIQIYKDLKVLCSLSFNLCIDVDVISEQHHFIQRQFVRDTIVEHHLFSWEI